MSSAPELPDPVHAVCSDWHTAIDERAPGLVIGRYLRGGPAFGDLPRRGLDTASFTAYVVAAGTLTHQ